ncbi:hypothetical protein RBH29_03640 [Herbivorax sp. ANBcel31]|uniref:hypothetical protein n=1 Tax=Herbivorax sp. ANBcel31 TaxID=3069754 RepID=UPI0027AF59A8|nr:hypothetical protein [Herbivorax sp. ANBcel31]MDQ2085525.1 hypothetical protein [Herbivorax sp. ANBcel31]
MNAREGILDALVDGGESIVQIKEYLDYLSINIDKDKLINEIKLLFRQRKIRIEYPPEVKDITELDSLKIEDYWFELTEEGWAEWNLIKS